VRNSIVDMFSPSRRAREARFGKSMFALAAATPARINGRHAAPVRQSARGLSGSVAEAMPAPQSVRANLLNSAKTALAGHPKQSKLRDTTVIL
jgi:hypothetical protein